MYVWITVEKVEFVNLSLVKIRFNVTSFLFGTFYIQKESKRKVALDSTSVWMKTICQTCWHNFLWDEPQFGRPNTNQTHPKLFGTS